MDSFELPLSVVGQQDYRWSLSVSVDRSARLFGGNEAWYLVSILRDGNRYDGATASQPYSCFQAVSKGRRTAMMCSQGMLALHLVGEEVNIDFHTLTGEHVVGHASAPSYRSYLDQLDSNY